MKYKMVLFLLSGMLLYASNVAADKTILAGGCFWCMESDFEKLEGVTDVVSGFTGGTLKDPTYNGNHEGHYEAIEITYDSDKSVIKSCWSTIGYTSIHSMTKGSFVIKATVI